MKRLMSIRGVAILLFLSGAASIAFAVPEMVVQRHVVGGGGGVIGAGNISLKTTVGQPAVGSVFDPERRVQLHSGFWTPGSGAVSGVGSTPVGPRLFPNTPNPFNPLTTIRFNVGSQAVPVRLLIHDDQGRLVRTLVDGIRGPGPENVSWRGRNDRGVRVASGLYFYQLQVDGRSLTRKMMLVR